MSNRVFIGNLPFGITEEELRSELFSLGYKPTEISVPKNRETGQGRGFAFVAVDTPQLAGHMISNLAGQYIGGRSVNVATANEKPTATRHSGGGRANEKSFEVPWNENRSDYDKQQRRGGRGRG